MRNEFGILFGPRLDDEEEIDEDEEEESDDDGEEEVPKAIPNWKKRPEITSDQPMLAVRIGLYDPKKGDAIEPQIHYAVMQDWSVGGVTPQAGEALVLQRYRGCSTSTR